MTTLDLTAGDKQAGRSERLAQGTRVLCVLFFVSGFPALIYQLAWQRALFRIFGVNIESVTIVVTAFMLGLGLGSLAGGWLSKRPGIALLPLLAAIELATAAFGLGSLAVFEFVGEATAGWPLPAMAAVNLALVIVPTLLMGATLPVLVGHLVRRTGNVGSAVGLLYYVNTLGAGAACLACTLLLFPFLGSHGALLVAVALNAAVAIGALVAHWRDRKVETPVMTDAPRARAAPQPLIGFAMVLALAAAGGFVSLSYEIFFFRTVSYASGSSATAFAITLSVFLVGLASGARQAGEYCATLPRGEMMRRAVRGLMTANLIGLLYLPLLDHLAWLDRGIIGVAMLLSYVVARFWGALLPYLAELGIAADGQAGMRTAFLYLANILGSAAGSILTGFVLMEYLGLIDVGVALVVAGLLCTILLLVTLDLPRWHKIARTGAAAAVAVLAIALMPRWSAHVLETLQWKGSANAKPFVRVIENRSGVITVDSDGTVFGHGMYDGKFNTDLKHDSNGIVRPYALSPIPPGAARRADDRVVLWLMGAGDRQQPRCRLLDHHRDQSGLPEPDRASARGRLGAPQPQGHDRDRRRPALAAAQSAAPLRRDRLQYDLAFPCQRHQSGVSGIPRPRAPSPQGRWHLLLQHHRLRPHPAHRLPRLSLRRPFHQPHGGVAVADRLGFRPLAAHAGILPDRWARSVRRCAHRRPPGSRPPDGNGRQPHGRRLIRITADRALPRHPGPHHRQTGGDRRQHGQRVALFPRAGIAVSVQIAFR